MYLVSQSSLFTFKLYKIKEMLNLLLKTACGDISSVCQKSQKYWWIRSIEPEGVC